MLLPYKKIIQVGWLLCVLFTARVDLTDKFSREKKKEF